MPRYLVILEYLGTCFHGFQKQPDVPTVQGALEEALATLTGEEVRVAGAGRTDAGVHALGQAAAFNLTGEVDEPRAIKSLNALLPPGAAVTGMRPVPENFDPRRDAQWREYRYFILNRSAPSPLIDGTAYHLPGELNGEVMERACALLQGEHDFAAFTVGAAEEPALRTVLRCGITHTRPELICMVVRADSFLYRMVRVMAGAVLSVGRGRMDVSELEGRLDGGKGPCADPLPARGLFLWEVSYPPGKLER